MKPRTVQVEYGGVLWTRYPDSNRRSHRVYYQRHEKNKEPPVFLHRRIYEDNFGPIPSGWHIHHKDGNTENNSPDNLQLLSPSEHSKITISRSLSNKKIRERMFSCRENREWRQKMSEAQKHRVEIEITCDLCGRVFKTKNHSGNGRWCPRCKDMLYSDKNGQHFSRRKQIERFGKVLIPYDKKVSNVDVL